MDINITVRNKIAKLAKPIVAVCGNSDYVVKFDFDSEWDAFENKTARFKYNGEYIDIIFTGNECNMPVIKNAYRVEIGVYAGDLHTTTSAFLIMKKSITSDNGTPAAPAPDVYDQLMQRMNEIEAPEAVLYTKQILTDEQKAQARNNIGAAKDNAVVYLQDSVTPTKLVQAIIKNPKSIIGCVFEFSNDNPVSQMTFLPIYKHYRGSGEHHYLGYAIGNYDIQNSKNMPFDVYKYDARDDMGSYTVFLTPMHENKSVLDSITGIVTTNKLTSPDHPTDLVAYDTFQAAVPRVQQMNISGVSVGQTIKVKTVDTDGRPTSWEAADMAGGEKKEWTKIIDVAITEATMFFEATGLDNATELYCEWTALKTASETDKRDLDLYINDIAVGVGWVTNYGSNGQLVCGYSTSEYNGLVWYNTKTAGIAGVANKHNTSMSNNAKISYGLTHGVGAATKVQIKALNAANAPVTGQIEVWAR